MGTSTLLYCPSRHRTQPAYKRLNERLFGHVSLNNLPSRTRLIIVFAKYRIENRIVEEWRIHGPTAGFRIFNRPTRNVIGLCLSVVFVTRVTVTVVMWLPELCVSSVVLGGNFVSSRNRVENVRNKATRRNLNKPSTIDSRTRRRIVKYRFQGRTFRQV